MSHTPRHCSVCGRPCAGHPGRYGPSCALPHISTAPSTSTVAGPSTEAFYTPSSTQPGGQFQFSDVAAIATVPSIGDTGDTSDGNVQPNDSVTVTMDGSSSEPSTPVAVSGASAHVPGVPGSQTDTGSVQGDNPVATALYTTATAQTSAYTAAPSAYGVNNGVAGGIPVGTYSQGGVQGPRPPPFMVGSNVLNQSRVSQVSTVSGHTNLYSSQIRARTMPIYAPDTTTWSVHAPQSSIAHLPTPVIDHQAITSMTQQMASLQAQMDSLRVAQANLGLVPVHNWHASQHGAGASHVANIDYLPGHQAAAPHAPAAPPVTPAHYQQVGPWPRPTTRPNILPVGITGFSQPVGYPITSASGNAYRDEIRSTAGQPVIVQQQVRPGIDPRAIMNEWNEDACDFSVSSLRNIDVIDNVQQYSPVEGLSDRSIRNALKGNYCLLEEFLPPVSCTLDQNENETLMESATGIISYKSKKSQQSITGFGTWLQAYLNYQHVMVRVHGLVAYYAMHDYISYIYDSDIKFQWDTVYAFDIRHRQRIGGKTINMKAIDPLMVATTLDKVSVKDFAKCTRCKSRNHCTDDCPLTVAAPPSGSKRNRSSSRGKSKDEICKKFNIAASSCSYQGCRRQHKCYGCKGDLPFRECCITGPCSAKPGANEKS